MQHYFFQRELNRREKFFSVTTSDAQQFDDVIQKRKQKVAAEAKKGGDDNGDMALDLTKFQQSIEQQSNGLELVGGEFMIVLW